MKKEWSEQNKSIQLQLKKNDTFAEGIDTLIMLRKGLMHEILQFKDELSQEDFFAMPFMNAKGYHCKSIGYSFWHIFRIEDIVAHSLIADDEQIFFRGDYEKRIGAPIITTGNELVKEEIREFSKKLQIDELYNYMVDVDKATTEILKSLTYQNLKDRISIEKRNKLEELQVVSTDENAYWLVDYWCNKEIADRLRAAFASWYDNGHTNEDDPNTIILKIKLTDGILFSNGTKYEF